jgi:hypothetical protein
MHINVIINRSVIVPLFFFVAGFSSNPIFSRVGPESDEFSTVRRVRADQNERRSSEVKVDSRKATPRHGIRWQSTNLVGLESPLRAR